MSRLLFPTLILGTAMLAIPAQAGPPRGAHSDHMDRSARTSGPAAGELAPDFTLRMLNSDQTVQLSEKLGKERPVVLVFGSYT